MSSACSSSVALVSISLPLFLRTCFRTTCECMCHVTSRPYELTSKFQDLGLHGQRGGEVNLLDRGWVVQNCDRAITLLIILDSSSANFEALLAVIRDLLPRHDHDDRIHNQYCTHRMADTRLQLGTHHTAFPRRRVPHSFTGTFGHPVVRGYGRLNVVGPADRFEPLAYDILVLNHDGLLVVQSCTLILRSAALFLWL
jgi:hypothetical protein